MTNLELREHLDSLMTLKPPHTPDGYNAPDGLCEKFAKAYNEVIMRAPITQETRNLHLLTPCKTCKGERYSLSWRQLIECKQNADVWLKRLLSIESYEQFTKNNYS